jgi:cyanophycin synthetase
VGERIADLMFLPGENGRVPIVAVTGVNGKTTTTRLIAHILGVTGRTVGLTCTDGIYIGSAGSIRRLQRTKSLARC